MEEVNTSFQYSFLTKSDKDNEFSVEINSNSSSLNIIINSKNKVPAMIYQESFSLEKIKKNKYFSICDSMKEIITVLLPIIKNINNIKLLEKTNEVELLITLPHPICPQISFNLKAKKKDTNDSINELYELISNLTKKVENQQNIINEQNNKIKNLEEKINLIENENKKIIEIKKQEKINLEKFSIKNSTII